MSYETSQPFGATRAPRSVKTGTIILALSLAYPLAAAAAERAVPAPWSYSHSVLKPVNMLAVRISSPFWKSRIDINAATGWFDIEKKLDENGHLAPFRVIAEGRDAATGGKSPNNDEFVYKWMEAGGYYAGYPGGGAACERIRSELSRFIDVVLRTQKPDGYINTFFGNRFTAARLRPPFDPENRFEFYDFGHLTQAAIALYRTTGDRKFLDAAIRFADLIVDRFGAPNHLPYRLNRGPLHLRNEHPNHEMAMVELYRVTGNKRYLDFARQTLDEYNFCSRWELDGHAVQEALLNCGAADVYLETGDKRFLDATTRLWDDMVSGKMYVTGGIGSRFDSESIRGRFELPDEAYAETCASIGSLFWAYRLLLATGDARYGDLMERLMYNGLISGLGLSGTDYFYTNPLVDDGKPHDERHGAPRRPWYKTPCCPPNLARFLASLGGYFYATGAQGISVVLYGANEANIPFRGQTVRLRQRTEYPWDGRVRIQVDPQSPGRFALRLRIPSWAEGRPVSSDLYRYLDAAPGKVEVLVNGAAAPLNVKNGFAALDREWKTGDTVELRMPMPVRRVVAHEAVLNLRGRVALERGPVVYCAEGVDNGGKALHLGLPDSALLRAEFAPNTLGGATIIRATGRTPLTAIPYALWANRGAGEMTVWLGRLRPSRQK